jgi:type I restriction modification DNA specificity domain protein
MKKYDEYKDSGVAWIGEVPKHWKVLHLKHSLDGLQDGTHGTYASVDAGKVLLSAKNVTEHGLIIGESERTISDIDHKEIVSNGFPQQGDILLCCVGTLGRCCIFEYPFPIAFQRSVTFLRTNSLLSNRMLLYILRNKYIDTQFQLFAKTSAQSGVYMGDLKDFYIVVPPINEQTAIAAYLDTHCAKIDNLISIQQKRIALLQELKQSVITHAVTKGLNPNVEIKQLGVEWIGDVPKHWEIRKIKTLSAVKRGASPRPIDDPKYFAEGGEFSWVRIADVSASDKYLTTTTQKLSKLGSSLSVKRFPGDIFISIAGTVGKPIISSIKCCIHDGFVYFPYLKNMNTEFLYYIFMSGQPYLGLGKMGTQLNLNTETIGNIDIPYPPITEQAAIASYLDHKCATIDTSISNAQHQIELLQEYKQSLITEVVTGKYKVC